MQPVRGRGTGARTTNWCEKTPTTTPYDLSPALNTAEPALPHYFLGGALLPRRRTTSSAAHPMQLVRERQTGARPTNWCANDKLVRQGGRGCPQAAR
jgi:hypothetical protein